jgi:organic radical activating enzyme
MQKVIPIKVQKAIPMMHKFIEWKIHNVCNHDCSFCDARHKDGSQRWFTLEKYKEYTDKLVDACEGKPFWIQITGGEPTLYPKLIELMKYMKQKGAFVSLISNGTRTLRWWKELKSEKILDYLFITYHSEMTDDYKHIGDILNLFIDEPTETVGLVTHVKDTIDLAFEAQDYLVKNTGSIITLKAMIVGDYNIYDYYNNEQLQQLKDKNWTNGNQAKYKKRSNLPIYHRINHTLNITYSDNVKMNMDPQLLMKNQENNFEGWMCKIGDHNMRIDHDIIYRGVCEVGGSIKLDNQKINFRNDYVKCTSNACFCGTDMIAEKIRVIEDK